MGKLTFFLGKSLNLVANQFLIFFKVLRSPLLPCAKRRSCHEIMLKKKVSELASSLTFASKGMVEGDSAESRLARAGYYLEAGNLVAAVREIDALDDAAKVPASHWLILAKERLAAQQAIKLARAHVKCTAETFVKSYGQ